MTTSATDRTVHDSLWVHVVSSGIAAGLTWMFFTWTDNWMAYEHYGPIAGNDLGRVLAVAFDLYVVGSIFNSAFDQLGRPLREHRHRLAFVVGCLALAATLNYTGTLRKVYTAFGLRPPGPAASIGMLRSHHFYAQAPNLPLEEFAGDWYGAFHKNMPQNYARGRNTISRVQVSVANGGARMQIWRSCPQRECDGGTFPAIIESRRPGTVVALHATGTMDGLDWLMSLSTQKDHLMLEEHQIRGNDMNTRYVFSDWMTRKKP